jgi:hypothetical protein
MSVATNSRISIEPGKRGGKPCVACALTCGMFLDGLAQG